MNAKLENRKLNQILRSLTRYLTQSTRSTLIAMPIDIPPVAALIVMALGRRAQANNSKSVARPLGHANPRVRRSRVCSEALKIINWRWKLRVRNDTC